MKKNKERTMAELRKLAKRRQEAMYSPDAIHEELDPGSTIPIYTQSFLSETLSLLPHEVIDFVTENCVFISLDEDIKGQTWKIDDLPIKRDKGYMGYIIIFNSGIWKDKPVEIAFTIAHEVAHVWKGHISKSGGKKAFREYTKQEKEADRLAVKWLSKHYKKESLMKLCSSKSMEKWKI